MPALQAICVSLLALLVTRSLADGPSYTSSREVLVSFALNNTAPVETVNMWVTRDGGKTWRAEPADRVGRSTLCYRAPDDGWYGFYLVLRNSAGASADPPTPGAEPHVRVVVDTAAPVLQVHTSAGQMFVEPGRPLTLRASLIEENLGDESVRVFYRASESQDWTDGGVAIRRPTELVWNVPADIPNPFDLCFVATDLAGNRSVEELRGISFEQRRPPEDKAPTSPGDASSVEPPAPHPTTTIADAADSHAPADPKIPVGPDARRLAYLRQLAERFRVQGQYGLAVARLEEALRIAPQDVGLLVDLASALYGSTRYDDAEARFRAVLELAPDHQRALEGLALVAATQRRYSDARAHLLHLLRLAPESAQNWLRYGDIEHKLGNQPRALEVWERVLGMDAADETVRAAARKRLDYFGSTRPRPER